ncbi:SRPBCC family protein [Leptospira ilyithenensis]|uniref:Polyketide cyclase n=1 Tax=Leptospira ilyithenensis TaxID=2484901 RepID=A0A4R9LMC7_9LEPT|nr:SRPBCC family protein [Leptospira ilyithenensis]TGN09702.1 polyketide cyclase [Leptospira ilyithenensis]
MVNTNTETSKLADREIISLRTLSFPRELVFKAWTEPERLARWWGPKDFRNTFEEFDLRPGGNWRFVMHGPNGDDYPNHCVFVEIVKPELLVFNHISPVHFFQVTASFEEVSTDKTKVIFRMMFESAEECDKSRPYIIKGNEENFDRLETELARVA